MDQPYERSRANYETSVGSSSSTGGARCGARVLSPGGRIRNSCRIWGRVDQSDVGGARRLRGARRATAPATSSASTSVSHRWHFSFPGRIACLVTRYASARHGLGRHDLWDGAWLDLLIWAPSNGALSCSVPNCLGSGLAGTLAFLLRRLRGFACWSPANEEVVPLRIRLTGAGPLRSRPRDVLHCICAEPWWVGCWARTCWRRLYDTAPLHPR